MLNVALPKGRLGEKVYATFEKAGFPCPSIKVRRARLLGQTLRRSHLCRTRRR